MQIIDVMNEDAFEDFLKLPEAVYQDDPFYRHGNAKHEINVLVEQNPATKVLLIKDKARMVLIPGNDFGMIGYFDAHDDQVAVNALFDAALDYFTSHGLDQVVGPVNGDTWHSYRFNCGPHGKPFLFEPYNPVYYPKLWEQYGFTPIGEYYSRQITDISMMPGLLEQKYQKAVEAGFSFRSLDASQFDKELKLLYDISCASFVDNFLYTEITFDDFFALYKPAENFIVPPLIQFVMSPEGEAVGYFFGIPNDQETFNGKTVAVSPAYRQHGLGTALQYLVYQHAIQLGFKHANLCLIHQGNPSDKINKELGDLIRTYKLYGYRINES